MAHRNKRLSFSAALFLGLCAVLGACDEQLGAGDDLADTDDYIDQDVPPGVQQIEEVACGRGSICFQVTLDTGQECVVAEATFSGATRQELAELCAG